MSVLRRLPFSLSSRLHNNPPHIPAKRRVRFLPSPFLPSPVSLF